MDELIRSVFEAHEARDDHAFVETATILCQMNRTIQGNNTREFRDINLKREHQLHPMLIDGDSHCTIFQDINDEYTRGRYGGFDAIIMKSNGYVNATKLCSNGGKQFRHWTENTSSRNIINSVSSFTGIDTIDLTIKVITGSKLLTITRGTYVHPALITHIAYWCSTDFACKVCMWIEKWKSYSEANQLEYWTALRDIKCDFNEHKEKQIQLQLSKELGGEPEKATPVGNIDLLTDTEVIEIKTYANWKHALGQIIAYGSFYPLKQKVIYLFDVSDGADLTHVERICSAANINLRIL